MEDDSAEISDTANDKKRTKVEEPITDALIGEKIRLYRKQVMNQCSRSGLAASLWLATPRVVDTIEQARCAKDLSTDNLVRVALFFSEERDCEIERSKRKLISSILNETLVELAVRKQNLVVADQTRNEKRRIAYHRDNDLRMSSKEIESEEVLSV